MLTRTCKKSNDGVNVPVKLALGIFKPIVSLFYQIRPKMNCILKSRKAPANSPIELVRLLFRNRPESLSCLKNSKFIIAYLTEMSFNHLLYSLFLRLDQLHRFTSTICFGDNLSNTNKGDKYDLMLKSRWTGNYFFFPWSSFSSVMCSCSSVMMCLILCSSWKNSYFNSSFMPCIFFIIPK